MSHLILPPSLHAGEGSSFPGLVPSEYMVNSESVMGIKPGDSGTMSGYQVDKFTCTWSAELFMAHSHIYPGFTGKVSSLSHFPLELGCDDYSFLDQAMADFEQGLDSILTDSLETPELDPSLDEPDAVSSSVSFMCVHSVSTLSDNSKLQLASSIRSHKLWCQTRALLAPVPLATRMSASKLICYFSSHPAASGFRSLTPADNITLTSANRKADQSIRFAEWCWCCCSCHSWHRATHLPPQSFSSWYSFLSAQFWGRHYTCVWSAWITFQVSQLFEQCCLQMSWQLHWYFSPCV